MALLLFCLRWGIPCVTLGFFVGISLTFHSELLWDTYLYFCNWDLFSSILKGTIPLFCVEFRPVELHVQCMSFSEIKKYKFCFVSRQYRFIWFHFIFFATLRSHRKTHIYTFNFASFCSKAEGRCKSKF